MENTIQVIIDVKDERIREELIAMLSQIDFTAFEERGEGLDAFINESKFDEVKLAGILAQYQTTYKSSLVEAQNWNALWESSFDPVVVNDFCVIRAQFHDKVQHVKHEIVITPKMSFGTGHHATTYLMIEAMRNLDFENKSVADFGTGTGILAILAEKMGSKNVYAIDNDDWSIENARENISNNQCTQIDLQQQDSFAPTEQFDVVLANINKHVILKNVNGLFFGIKNKGYLVLSGLLKQDEADILTAFQSPDLLHLSTQEKNNWISLLFQHT